MLGADDPIFVKGRLEVGEDRMQVIAAEVVPLAEAIKTQKNGNGDGNGKNNGHGDKIHLYVREAEVSSDELVRLRDTLLDYPGYATVFLHMLGTGQSETVIELPDQVRIASTPELEATVERLFGARVSFHSLNS
jgi:hypothetical protein